MLCDYYSVYVAMRGGKVKEENVTEETIACWQWLTDKVFALLQIFLFRCFQSHLNALGYINPPL